MDNSQTLALADAIGRKRIAETMGVQATAVSNAVVRGRFPARWFLKVQTLAREAGVPCPPEAFGIPSDETVAK